MPHAGKCRLHRERHAYLPLPGFGPRRGQIGDRIIPSAVQVRPALPHQLRTRIASPRLPARSLFRPRRIERIRLQFGAAPRGPDRDRPPLRQHNRGIPCREIQVGGRASLPTDMALRHGIDASGEDVYADRLLHRLSGHPHGRRPDRIVRNIRRRFAGERTEPPCKERSTVRLPAECHQRVAMPCHLHTRALKRNTLERIAEDPYGMRRRSVSQPRTH